MCSMSDEVLNPYIYNLSYHFKWIPMALKQFCMSTQTKSTPSTPSTIALNAIEHNQQPLIAKKNLASLQLFG
jgi:hypothetical protein